MQVLSQVISDSISDTESEEEDTTKTLANKMGKVAPPKASTRAFKFRSFTTPEKKKIDSPSSSPIPLPSPDDVMEISSDEELEKSMVKLKEVISLEMDSE